MGQTENQGRGSFSMLKECKNCGHTMLDHSTRPEGNGELETGACNECECDGFAE